MLIWMTFWHIFHNFFVDWNFTFGYFEKYQVLNSFLTFWICAIDFSLSTIYSFQLQYLLFLTIVLNVRDIVKISGKIPTSNPIEVPRSKHVHVTLTQRKMRFQTEEWWKFGSKMHFKQFISLAQNWNLHWRCEKK